MLHKFLLSLLCFSLLISCSGKQEEVLPEKTSWINISSGDSSLSINEDGINIQVGDDSMILNNNALDINITELNSSDEIEASEVQETLNCENHYTELLWEYGKEYNQCSFKKPDTSSCELSQWERSNINIAVVFDSSGSMGKQIGGESMMKIAQEEVGKYISSLDDNIRTSLVLYGHKWASTAWQKDVSCAWVELASSFSPNNKNSIVNTLNAQSPVGWTPIQKSLEIAHTEIQKYSKDGDKNIILLVSDGEETCWGNPVNTATKITSEDTDTYIDVIGFNVDGAIQRQLQDIASNGKGSYYNVKSRIDFENVFQNTKNFLEAKSCGASKSAIELSYGTDAINTYFSCMYDLREEQVLMLTNSQEQCQSYVRGELRTREDLYSKQFEDIRDQGEEILDNFADFMEDIKEGIEK